MCPVLSPFLFTVSPEAALELLPSFWWSEASWSKSCFYFRPPVAFLFLWGIYLLFTFFSYLLLLSWLSSSETLAKVAAVKFCCRSQELNFQMCIFQFLWWQTVPEQSPWVCLMQCSCSSGSWTHPCGCCFKPAVTAMSQIKSALLATHVIKLLSPSSIDEIKCHD